MIQLSCLITRLSKHRDLKHHVTIQENLTSLKIFYLRAVGNASTFAGEYLEKMGAIVVGVSDSKGSILIPKGSKVSKILEHKAKTGS
ncbi:MAG: hypothetical protein HN757_14855, partial [Calditrichaeota bacterium]|nr:hypothetical protein [Calditrichota bacterium]